MASIFLLCDANLTPQATKTNVTPYAYPTQHFATEKSYARVRLKTKASHLRLSSVYKEDDVQTASASLEMVYAMFGYSSLENTTRIYRFESRHLI